MFIAGDLILDNYQREGIVLSRAQMPDKRWIQLQEDIRVRDSDGPWWNVLPLDGGGVLVPEDLASFVRRATVDDLLRVVESDATDGNATLIHLFNELRSKQERDTR